MANEGPRNSVPATLTHQLIGDYTSIRERLRSDDTPTTRRELVRAAFAAVEGLLWQLKQSIARDAARFSKLSTHERAALAEETYSVDDRGIVRPQPRFQPTSTSIRLVVNTIQKYRPEYVLDFTHAGWQCIKDAIEARNRIVHPKALTELDVSDLDIANCDRGIAWFLAFVIEVMQEHVDHWKGIAR